MTNWIDLKILIYERYKLTKNQNCKNKQYL